MRSGGGDETRPGCSVAYDTRCCWTTVDANDVRHALWGGRVEDALRNGGCAHEFDWNTMAPRKYGRPGAPYNKAAGALSHEVERVEEREARTSGRAEWSADDAVGRGR